MATTKIWVIKDSLSRVVNYAKNPEKTKFSDLKQVLMYAENDEKTTVENEKTMYVTGVNCDSKTAYEEMNFVQKKFDKCTGNIAYHAYQSFKTGEVSQKLAHKIGVELAKEMWSEYQVVVATHFNTGTYHNYFVVNSVNMFTGKKFNCNKGAYYKFREISDRLCRENNLTVIENPKGKTPRSIYFAEKRGEPTKYNLMRQAIDKAVAICLTYDQFKKVMYKNRYSNEIRLIVTEKIKTVEDVKGCITRTEESIEGVKDLRQKYRNKLRNCKDDKMITEYKLKISDCTNILTRYRKNIKTANCILEDIPKVKEIVKIERQMQKAEKEKNKDRYAR